MENGTKLVGAIFRTAEDNEGNSFRINIFNDGKNNQDHAIHIFQIKKGDLERATLMVKFPLTDNIKGMLREILTEKE